MNLPMQAVLSGVVAVAVVSGNAAAHGWQVVSVNDAPAIEGGAVSFSDDGTFSGTSGCNLFNGNVAMDNRALLVTGPVASTKMACPGDALSRQDDALVALFQGRIEIEFDPLRGVLTLQNDQVSVGLVAAGPTIPAAHVGQEPPRGEPPYLAAFGAEDRLDIRAEASTGAKVLSGVHPGTVLRSDGCEPIDGITWCKVSLADGSLTGWAPGDFLEPADSSLRAGQAIFDATGLVPCAKEIGAPTTQCPFGVARDGGGNATVVVYGADGLNRALFFADGALVGADTSEADGGHEVTVTREGDLNFIRVNDERYEIPDAVPFGG